jgi:hypothetical protein
MTWQSDWTNAPKGPTLLIRKRELMPSTQTFGWFHLLGGWHGGRWVDVSCVGLRSYKPLDVIGCEWMRIPA